MIFKIVFTFITPYVLPWVAYTWLSLKLSKTMPEHLKPAYVPIVQLLSATLMHPQWGEEAPFMTYHILCVGTESIPVYNTQHGVSNSRRAHSFSPYSLKQRDRERQNRDRCAQVHMDRF